MRVHYLELRFTRFGAHSKKKTFKYILFKRMLLPSTHTMLVGEQSTNVHFIKAINLTSCVRILDATLTFRP